MADIELTYGPGSTVAVLEQSLKSLGFMAKLDVASIRRDDALEGSLRLWIGVNAGQHAAALLQKRLLTCFPIFASRQAELLLDIGEGRTIRLRLRPPQNRAEFKEGTIGFYRWAEAYFDQDTAGQDDILAGARFDQDGIADLELTTPSKFAWARSPGES